MSEHFASRLLLLSAFLAILSYASAAPKIEVALKNVSKKIGEGPFWDVYSQTLWFIDVLDRKISHWNPLTGNITHINVNGSIGFAIPSTTGELIAGVEQSIVRVDPVKATGTIVLSVESGSDTRFNDAKVDSTGRLWAGTMGNADDDGSFPPGLGSLYTLGPDYRIEKQLGNLAEERTTVSNGIDFSNDNKIFYFVDSTPRKIFAFDLDIDRGVLTNQRIVLDFDVHLPGVRGLPDGITVDSEDKLWVAMYQGGRVYRVDPKTRQVLTVLEFPASVITSLCFGGKDLDVLYVTSGTYGLSDPSSEPLAGSLFKVTGLGVKGRPGNFFKG